MTNQHILVIGSPVDGFEFEGPYNEREAAIYAGSKHQRDWWIATLDDPEQSETDKLAIQRDKLLLQIAHRFLREYDSEIHDGTMKELVAELDKVEKQMEGGS